MLLSLLCAGVLAKPDMAPLKTKLDAACRGFRGRIGYCVIRLRDGATIDLRGGERFPTASTIKTAIALEVLSEVEAGKRRMADKIVVPPTTDRKEWELSAWSYFLKDGTALDLDGWTSLMITHSDNLATRVLREYVGVREINANLLRLGLKNTKNLASAPKDDPVLRRLNGQFGMGMTTPNEMARLLQLLYKGQAAGPGATEKLLRLMSQQYWDDWIANTVPIDVKVASKSGAISRSRSDTAIVFSPTEPYVMTVYTDSQKDQSWDAENEGHRAIVRLGSLVWNHLHPNRPYTPSADYRKRFLPTGGGVE